MPITLMAPLLPPLKEPVGTVVEEDDEEVPVNGVEFEPKLEVVEVERPETEDGVPVPEEVEESEEVEERAASMSNVAV